MKFLEKKSLRNYSNPGSDFEEELEKSLLVGERCLAKWTGVDNGWGYDTFFLYPAYYGGERAFFLEAIWTATHNSSGEGETEKILTLEEGVRELLNHGKYEAWFE